jgi:Ca2+/Na+ antiporter
MKDMWLRFKAWIKGFPWFLAAGAAVVGILVLIFLVDGKLYPWDYFYMALVCAVVSVIGWKLGKKR